MVSATSELREIKKHAKSIKNDETHRLGEVIPGDSWAQGDLLIVAFDAVPKGCVPVDKPEPQLAPGNTQGSRHCLDRLDGVEMFRLKDATPLDGPVFRTNRVTEITHPEHGNLIGPPGVYGIVYQRQYAEDLRRVLD